MVTFTEIEAAYKRIKDVANKTPVLTSRTLNERLDAELFFKCENLQRIGAFKFRGAYNALSRLSEEQKARGVIAHSSGNHAQAIALSSKLLGIKAVIVMPKRSPLVKVNAARDSYGAEVVFCENTIASRQAVAKELIDRSGYTLVHPFDNDDIICGAGTAALELSLETGELDMIFAPVGGGGLLSGTAVAARGFNPRVKVFAGEPERVNDAYRSIEAGKILVNASTDSIADGLLTNLCERTFEIIKANVERIITVSEEEIIQAMWFIWERMKLVVEPSGAVSLAAALSGQVPLQNKRVGIIISGGNIDLQSFFAAIRQSRS
ncbi:MAG: pyridoxal-phosphate dependent enzyme [Candidatus Aminicenantes bacterium]|nr:pyridoxal-phosphate dependent enzyme [Candidatus Aminicenantes bacterium]